LDEDEEELFESEEEAISSSFIDTEQAAAGGT